jgi:hypothetical protein
LEQDRGYCFEWAAGPLFLTAPAVLRTVVSEPAVSVLRDNNVARQICEQSDLRIVRSAIKFVLANTSSPMSKYSDQVINDIAGRYFLVLGAAAADLWSELPQELQQQLFERAVVLGHQGEQDESLREQLAKFLHDHHERTAQPASDR